MHVWSRVAASMLLADCTPTRLPVDASTSHDTTGSEVETSTETMVSGPTEAGTTEAMSTAGVEPPACMNVTMTEVTTTGDSDSETTDADGPCTGGEISSGCCCFVADEGGKHVDVVCDVTFPCPDIELHCSEEDIESCGGLVTACDAAIDCALDVLIQGKPAGIRWGYDHYNYEGVEAVLYLAGDGSGFRNYLSWEDVSGSFDAIDRRSLNSAAYFTACKRRATAMERFDCIEHAFDDSHAPTEVCVPGSSFDWY